MRTALLPVVSLVLGSCTPVAPAITIGDAWARATAPGQSSAAIYATISNAGGNERLVGVHTPLGIAMLHSNMASGGIARMRPAAEVPIGPRGEVVLAPGGVHVMLSGLKKPLVAGTHFPATFRFAVSGEKTVEVTVVAAGSR